MTQRNVPTAVARHEVVVRNELGELEVIDMITGELLSHEAKPLHTFAFDYAMAMMICQEVRNGRTILDIGNDPKFPPHHVIAGWQRIDKMFSEELRLARAARAEVYHDKVMEIAGNAANLDYQSKNDIDCARLAADQFKWGAEKNDPSKFGNKVTHEGSKENPIVMRVIDTGIHRRKPDVIVDAIIKGEENGSIGEEQERREDQEDQG